MSDRLTAVVLGYWPNRRPNIAQIVTDLIEGTRAPDRIIVMLQAESIAYLAEHHDDPRVEVIATPSNFHTRAKFVAALLDISDYYLLMDDDTSVGPRTCEYLLDNVQGPPQSGFVTGYWGTILRNGSFMNGTIVVPASLDKPIRVDAFHGRAIFCDHRALQRLIRDEYDLRRDDYGELVWPDEGDDLIVGMVNHSWMLPMAGDGVPFKDLDECGQALQFGSGRTPEESYFEMRDAFCAHVLKRMADLGRTYS